MLIGFTEKTRRNTFKYFHSYKKNAKMGLSMASVWMLSKESMKGMDIVSISTDILYAFELASKNKISKQDLREKCEKGTELLSLLNNAIISQTKMKMKTTDLFMLRVVESLEKSTGQAPSQLKANIEAAKKELEMCRASASTTTLLERVSQAVMNMTSRSVEEISASLR